MGDPFDAEHAIEYSTKIAPVGFGLDTSNLDPPTGDNAVSPPFEKDDISWVVVLRCKRGVRGQDRLIHSLLEELNNAPLGVRRNRDLRLLHSENNIGF